MSYPDGPGCSVQEVRASDEVVGQAMSTQMECTQSGCRSRVATAEPPCPDGGLPGSLRRRSMTKHIKPRPAGIAPAAETRSDLTDADHGRGNTVGAQRRHLGITMQQPLLHGVSAAE